MNVEKNIIVNNPVYWNYGGGVSGVTVKIANNIIYNPSETSDSYSQGLYFTGGTSKNDLITGNLIVSNGASLNLEDSYTDPSNKTFSFNTFIGQPLESNSTISIYGTGHVFSNNNFTKVNSNYVIKNTFSATINAENNYWGTINESEIQAAIYDFGDDFELGAVDYSPFSTSMNTTAPISPPANVTKSVSGSDVILNWSANEESDLVGYKLHYGSPTGYSYTSTVDLGNVTTYTITGGDIATEYAITSYDSSLDGTDDVVDGNESWFSVANQLNVTLNSSTTSISEPTNSATLTATLDNTSSADVVVNLTYTGTATNATDYSAAASITIPFGSLTATTAITAIDDTDVELTETIIIDMGDVSGASESGTQQVTINLTDNDLPSASITVDNLTIQEDGGVSVITATLSAIHSKSTTIPLTISGTATLDTDYSTDFVSGTISGILAGGNGQGSANNQFNFGSNPYGWTYDGGEIEVDSSGNIYIADTQNNRVIKWAPGADEGTVVAGGNGAGSNLNQLNNPTDIHVDSSGNLYVLDTYNNRIVIWAPDATVGVLRVDKNNGAWSWSNTFWSFDVDISGNVYTTDWNDYVSKVHKWADVSDPTSFSLITDMGESAVEIEIDDSNNIYVIANGQYVKKKLSGVDDWEIVAAGFGVNKRDFQVDSAGNIYVLDTANNWIMKWLPGASAYDGVLVKDGLSDIVDINLDELNNIYFSDRTSNAIKKIQISPAINIVAGSSTGTLTITGIEDSVYDEGNETIILTPSTPVNGTLASSDATTITITNKNYAPVATAQTDLAATEQTEVTITLAGTDSENDTLSYIIVSLPTNGTLSDDGTVITADDLPKTTTSADVVYVSTSDTATSDSFTFKVNDGTVDSEAAATVSLAITAVNDAAVAVEDAATVLEDAELTSIDVIANDTDVDADTLTLTAVTTDGTGTVAVNADGVSVDYTPALDFNGTEVITYTVSDGTVDTTGTLTITVTAVNDAAVAVEDAATVLEDAELTSIDVIANDTDVDADTLTLTAVTTDGTGTVAVNADGVSVDYTPALDFNGTEVITYTVSDGTVDTTGTLTITVTAVNDAAVAVEDAATVLEDAELTSIDVIANDTDVDADTLTLTAVTTDGTGTVAVNADDVSVDYTPALDFNGTEVITYTVSDGTVDTTGTLTITVTAVNDAAVAVEDAAIVLEDAELTSIDVIANDTDVDADTLTLTAVTTDGTGTVAVNADGVSVDYTPALDFNGTEVITYTVSDGTVDTTGTLTITVTAVNDAAVAVEDAATVLEDAELTSIDVIANDTDVDADTLTLTAVTTDGTGTVAVNADGVSVDYTPALDFNGTEVITYTVSDGTVDTTGTLTITVTAVNDAAVAVEDAAIVLEDAELTSIDVIANDTDVDADTLTLTAVTTDGTGTVAVNADGVSVDYTPALDFNGTEVITYTVSDGTVDTTGTLTITVTAVNDAAVAVEDAATVLEDAELTSIDVIANDTDVDADTLTLTAVTTDGTGTVAVNADGVSVDYTPALDFNGTEVITYTVSDGTVDTTGTLTITVTAVNDAAVAVEDAATVLEDAELTSIDVIANDTDVDADTLTLTAVTTDGTGTVAVNADGVSVDYTPALDFNGTEVITYTVSDGTVDTTGTLTITVTAVNDAPVVNNHSILLAEQGTVSALENGETTLLYNASDVEGDDLVAILVTEPSNGILNLNSDGTFSYEHDGSETTSDSFTYKASDGNLESEVAITTITITNVNDNTPTDIVLSNNTVNENESNLIIGQFSAIDVDLPSDSHTYELVSGSGDDNNASFTINGNNLENIISFDFETLNELSIRVRVTDENNESYEKILNIIVLNINDINISFEITDTYCSGDIGDGTITINSISEVSGDLTFLWTASNNGVIPSGQSNNQSLTNLSPGTYNLSLSDSFFTYEETFDVQLISQYDGLSICYISSDETDVTNNRIFLNNEGNYNVAYYEILRESNIADVYESVGTVESTNNSFLDNTSDNTSQVYRYKVRLVDNCDIISVDSDYHETILLQSSLSATNSINLSWSSYSGVDYSTYNIYRKVNEGSFEFLSSVSSSNNTYNDQTADVTNNNYEYYIAIFINDCNTSAGKVLDTTELRSNIQSVSDSFSINEINLFDNLSIYPNPTNSSLNIKLHESLSFIKSEIYNVLGQIIMKTEKTNFLIDHLSDGTYFIKVFTDKGLAIKKFVKN